jgi:aminoglycoside phosphotransferase family enzyme
MTTTEPTPLDALTAKIRFLRQPGVLGEPGEAVDCKETHMSCVFLTEDRAFKLKKPIKLPYLDFSTLERRERVCRAELEINRRLARDVYLGIVPLTRSELGLEIGGAGEVVEWLIEMRRLDETRMLDRAIIDGWIGEADIARLSRRLVQFYRHTRRSYLSAEASIARWRQEISDNYAVLRNQRFGLPSAIPAKLFHIQQRFVATKRALFAQLVCAHRLVDGHGDLRPEHIWLGAPIWIIDGLEFDPRLRRLDPFDEVAYLSVECERLGAGWIGERIRAAMFEALGDGPSEQLFTFYRCYRATLRARLAVAHLLTPEVRTPHKWRPLALSYLKLALADAFRLEQSFRTPGGPRLHRPDAAGKSPRPGGAHRAAHQAWPQPAHRRGARVVPRP